MQRLVPRVCRPEHKSSTLLYLGWGTKRTWLGSENYWWSLVSNGTQTWDTKIMCVKVVCVFGKYVVLRHLFKTLCFPNAKGYLVRLDVMPRAVTKHWLLTSWEWELSVNPHTHVCNYVIINNSQAPTLMTSLLHLQGSQTWIKLLHISRRHSTTVLAMNGKLIFMWNGSGAAFM